MRNQFQKTMEDSVLQAKFDTSLDLENHYIEFGGDIQKRKMDISIKAEDYSDQFPAQAIRFGIYFNDKLRILNDFYFNLGGRLSSLSLNNHTLYFDPRVSVAYLITRNDIMRFSSGIYHQFGDYFTLEENNSLKPKKACHYSLSYDRITKDTELRLTLYNKEYNDLFCNQGEGTVSNDGYGYARGAEFFIKIKKKKYDILFVYNFLNSKRKEHEVQILAKSPYEINHSLTGIFKWNFNNASLGIRYSYASGLPYTPLLDREWDNENQIHLPVWGDPYSRRYPAYQRLDINGSKTFTFKKNLIVTYFGITNILNNKNILRYEYSDNYSIRKNRHSIFGRSIFIGVYIPFF